MLASPNGTVHTNLTGTIGSGQILRNSDDSDNIVLINAEDHKEERAPLPRLRSHSPERLRGEYLACRRQLSLNRPSAARDRHISFEMRTVGCKNPSRASSYMNGRVRANGATVPGSHATASQFTYPEQRPNYRTPGQVYRRQKAFDTTPPIYV